MNLSLVVLLGSLTLVACSSVTPRAPMIETPSARSAEEVVAETDRINEWFEAQFEEQLAFSPMQQTRLGRKTDNDKIDDMSITARDAQLAWRRASVAEMKATFDYDELTPEAQTSYDLWAYQLARAEAALPFRTNGYIFDQMSAIHTGFPQFLITFHPVDDASDMDAYVSRIEEAGRAINQLIDRSKINADTGVRPPRFAFDFVIDEASKIISGAPFDDSGEDSALWADAQAKITSLHEAGRIDEARAVAMTDAARAALTGPFRAAYENLIAWQEEDKVNAQEVTSGVSALPNGAAYYNERLANQTTTDLTADEIHEIGLAEVARLRTEMIAIKDQVEFEDDLPAFFAELRDNKDDRRYYYPDTDEGRRGYIDDATAVIDKIEAELPNYFGFLPKANLEVRRVEAFREQPGAAQHYSRGTPDGSRPGIYYAHLSDMAAMPKSELEVIAYHEGLLGHHLQLSVAQELTGVPTFRTRAGFTAYTEGWGLYAEWLAKEMPGTYQDPYSMFGRPGSEIWRAIRLVVDTGLHSKGWTEEEAVQYFLANSAITRAQARSEIRRYMVLPGQATSYKIGMLKIQELRRKAEAALGDEFDIRAFHDTVLGGGALPLAMLETRVDRWIADVQARIS